MSAEQSTEAPQKTEIGTAFAGSITLAEMAIEYLDRGVLTHEGAKEGFSQIAAILRKALTSLPASSIDGALLAVEEAKRDARKREQV